MEARRHRRAVRKILGRSRGTGESEDWHAQRETENKRSPSLSYPDDSSLAEVETVAWGTPAGQEDTGETYYLFFRRMTSLRKNRTSPQYSRSFTNFEDVCF